MKLYYKIYALIWSVVLILYLMGWSEFSIPLNSGLFTFLVISVIICGVLSVTGKSPKMSKIKTPSKNTGMVTFFLAVGFIINFLYAGYIPFIAILAGSKTYVSFPGIPTFYPFLITLSMYYYFFLVYNFISFPAQSKYLMQAGVLLLCFLLIFSRFMILLGIGGSALLYLLLNKGFLRRRRALKLIIAAISAVILLFLFGVLGNLRSGYGWNDCSYIEELGKFKNYPAWLPKQFMWAYLYAITPLANLNYNVAQGYHINDFAKLVVSIMPEWLSGRLCPSLVTAGQTLLIKSYFNAQTTFVESYYCIGLFGCYFQFAAFLAVAAVTEHFRKKYAPQSALPTLIITFFFALSFFYNVFYYSLTSLLVVWMILHLVFFKKSNRRLFVSLNGRKKAAMPQN